MNHQREWGRTQITPAPKTFWSNVRIVITTTSGWISLQWTTLVQPETVSLVPPLGRERCLRVARVPLAATTDTSANPTQLNPGGWGRWPTPHPSSWRNPASHPSSTATGTPGSRDTTISCGTQTWRYLVLIITYFLLSRPVSNDRHSLTTNTKAAKTVYSWSFWLIVNT